LAAEPSSSPEPVAGERFLAEIREQPDAIRSMLAYDREFALVARTMHERGASLVRMVGHGSSDNAASYGVYAFGLLPRWTALRDSITLTVYFRRGPDLSGSTVVALSQSGQTPDVVDYVERARAAGAFTVAITNDPSSELASAAEAMLPLAAGEEQAVAATKTYVNQLAALGLLAAHAAGRGTEFGEHLRATADRLAPLIDELKTRIPALALPFAFVGRMFVIGRGPEFATAREIALKLLETCRIAAEPLTSTDLVHGPIAALDSQFPVWTIASDDETLPGVLDAAERARAAGGTLVASGTAAHRVEGASCVVPVPSPTLSLCSPLLSVAPGQLFAWALARAKGLDPDRPNGLTKITLAR